MENIIAMCGNPFIFQSLFPNPARHAEGEKVSEVCITTTELIQAIFI